MKTMIQKEMDRNEHYIAANDYFKNIFTSIVSLSFACEILIRSIVNQFRDPKLLQTKIFRENININFYIVGKNIHYFFLHMHLYSVTRVIISVCSIYYLCESFIIYNVLIEVLSMLMNKLSTH